MRKHYKRISIPPKTSVVAGDVLPPWTQCILQSIAAHGSWWWLYYFEMKSCLDACSNIE